MMELKVLETRQLDRIHRASLEILATIGVRLPHEEMRRRFGVEAQMTARLGDPRAAILRPGHGLAHRGGDRSHEIGRAHV